MNTNNLKNSLKSRQKALQRERAELARSIPQVEADLAHYAALVAEGRRRADAVPGAGNANMEAVTQLVRTKSILETQQSRLREIDQALPVVEAQLQADETKRRCRSELDRLDVEISAVRAAIDADTKRAAELTAQREAALAAGEQAAEAEATALADGKAPEAGAGALEHAHRADVLARAIKQLEAKVAEGNARVTSLKEQKGTLQDEMDVAAMHAETAEFEAFLPSEFMPRLHRYLTARRRAYGRTDMPDLERIYRQWVEDQAGEEDAEG